MTTRKSTKRPASSKRMYIDYFPDLRMRTLQRDDRNYSYSKPVPVVLSASLPMSEDNMSSLRYHVKDTAYKGLLYDRAGRLIRPDDFKAFPRVYEVSVPKTSYKRALKKAQKITDERIDSYIKEGRDYELGSVMDEDLYRVVGDLARRTRARRRRSGRTSLRR